MREAEKQYEQALKNEVEKLRVLDVSSPHSDFLWKLTAWATDVKEYGQYGCNLSVNDFGVSPRLTIPSPDDFRGRGEAVTEKMVKRGMIGALKNMHVFLGERIKDLEKSMEPT